MPKNLCKWDPDKIQKKRKKYQKLTLPPTHTCTKCGRSAAVKDVLCKPEKAAD